MVYDVIIAGAGPVGVFLARELRLAKLCVLVLEQLEDPRSPLKRLPGGLASGPKPRGPAGHFAGIQFDYTNIDSSRLPGPADTHLGSEMEHLERVLAAAALAVGVEVERGHGVEGFESSGDEGELTVRAGGKRLRARWLVGCDGGRSTVRKQGRFEFVGTDPS